MKDMRLEIVKRAVQEMKDGMIVTKRNAYSAMVKKLDLEGKHRPY
jgi:hypothetical protein